MQPIATAITLQDIALRLLVAMVIGAVLGINRDLRDKPAGLKTLSLVSVGSAVLTLVSLSYATMSGTVDATAVARVTQGVITGIGFLGAGVIMRPEGQQTVQGLTTAASIWLAASLGIVCGVGAWSLALGALLAALLILVLGDPVEHAIYRRWHRRQTSSNDED